LQHGVVGDAGQRDAVVGKNVLIILCVLQYFFRLTAASQGLSLSSTSSRGSWSATPGAVWATGM
jgi:hypothetical protein